MSIRIPKVGEKRVIVKRSWAMTTAKAISFAAGLRFDVVRMPFIPGETATVCFVEQAKMIQSARMVVVNVDSRDFDHDMAYFTTAAEWNRCTKPITEETKGGSQ